MFNFNIYIVLCFQHIFQCHIWNLVFCGCFLCILFNFLVALSLSNYDFSLHSSTFPKCIVISSSTSGGLSITLNGHNSDWIGFILSYTSIVFNSHSKKASGTLQTWLFVSAKVFCCSYPSRGSMIVCGIICAICHCRCYQLGNLREKWMDFNLNGYSHAPVCVVKYTVLKNGQFLTKIGIQGTLNR